MSDRLPQRVAPVRLAETGGTVRGVLPIGELERLADSLHDTEGEVEVELAFGVDEIGTRHVRGHLRTVLHLSCQRCLQRMEYPLDVHFVVGLAAPGRADDFPERYDDVVEVEGETISVPDLVEDELILSLPIVPLHAAAECDYDRSIITVPEDDEAPSETEADRVRPFADLGERLGRARGRKRGKG